MYLKYQIPEEPPQDIVATIMEMAREGTEELAAIESVPYDPTNPALMAKVEARLTELQAKVAQMSKLRETYLNALKRLRLILWEDPALAGFSDDERLAIAEKMVKPLWFDSSRN